MRNASPVAPVWAWQQRPVATPAGWTAGILNLNGTAYAAECQFMYDDAEGHTWSIVDLRKADGQHYRLTFDPQGTPSCDCPHATYRDQPHTCKHATAIREACAALAEPVAADVAEPSADDWQDFAEWEAEFSLNAAIIDELHADVEDNLAALAADLGDDVEPPAPLCRHCSTRPGNRSRGLCWACHTDTSVRDQYGPKSVSGRRGVGNANSEGGACDPTDALPGTPEKVAVLELRAERGQALWHAHDARGFQP